MTHADVEMQPAEREAARMADTLVKRTQAAWYVVWREGRYVVVGRTAIDLWYGGRWTQAACDHITYAAGEAETIRQVAL